MADWQTLLYLVGTAAFFSEKKKKKTMMKDER
jgi:hypothetical protein